MIDDARATTRHAGEPIRVAALMDTVLVSGPGRQLVALAERLPACGVDLRIVLFHRRGRPVSPYVRFVADAGIPHHVLEDTGPLDAGLVRRLAALLDEWRPDVVQTHSYRPTALAWLLRRRGASWRWVGFFHGTTNEDRKVRVYHWLDRRLLPAADRIVVMSGPQAELFGGLGGKVRRIHNAVIPRPVAAAPDGPDLSSLPRPRLGVVGRLSAEKGVDVFLDALRLRADRGLPFSAAIVGDGPERARLEAQARALGLADRVRFVGTVVPIEPVYPQLDLVVLPSRSEGLPNVLLEALRADLPVVATRVGAVPEVLDDAAAGPVVAPESPADLADGIERALRLADDPTARAARRAVVERFSLDARVRAHLELYEDVLGRATRAVAGAGR